MKSLNENYVSIHGNTHETFADLMFLALIVLVLFVMALAIEVSQRVRAELAVEVPEPVPVVDAQELSAMTKEEVAELSKQLHEKQVEITQLRQKLESNLDLVESQKQTMQNQIAALNGEQRFTGAREPASLAIAYDYLNDKFYFISARESEHADRMNSGETIIEYSARKTQELVAIALKARKQRGFSQEEAKSIYQAFSTYQEVEPNVDSYQIVESVVGISYNVALCGYIAGDTEMSDATESIVDAKLLDVYQQKGVASSEMYPKVKFEIDESNRTISVNGVQLSARDAKEILLSLVGRGAMLDLEGLSGGTPSWLQEEVLTPAGYISKIPKLPSS